ncbi:MAG: hypothetical protein Q7W05_09135 [Deltaproteobacteria bacterium]|nr:hypothetical protein [Deltaproteobacteria bacterium]
MDAELKKKWVAALRSGEYRQGKHMLLDSNTNSYCCLGVLCVAAGKEPDSEEYAWLDRVTGDYGLLVKLNDDEDMPFPEIADYIEANL